MRSGLFLILFQFVTFDLMLGDNLVDVDFGNKNSWKIQFLDKNWILSQCVLLMLKTFLIVENVTWGEKDEGRPPLLYSYFMFQYFTYYRVFQSQVYQFCMFLVQLIVKYFNKAIH